MVRSEYHLVIIPLKMELNCTLLLVHRNICPSLLCKIRTQLKGGNLIVNDFRSIKGLTLENVCEHPLMLHLILSEESPASCIRMWRMIFFFSCFFPHLSQVTYWWQDRICPLRHSSLEKYFIQPGSAQNASTESNLTAPSTWFYR